MSRREFAFLAVLSTLLLVILVFLVASYVTVLRVRAVTGDERLSIQENIYGEAISLNRVIFALSRLFAHAHSVTGTSPHTAGSDETCVELGRAVISHAAIVQELDENFLSHFLDNDPLLLKERNRHSERAYRTELAKLTLLHKQLSGSEDAQARVQLLERFETQCLLFLAVLEERSFLLAQLEDTYYSHVEELVESQTANLNTFFVLQTILTVTLALVCFFFYYIQDKSRKELIRHRDHLSELVEEKTAELSRNNEELRKALENVKTLSGFLPICASCKKIRDDDGFWQRVEAYISAHAEVEFSHGICPECAERLYPGLVSP